MISSDKTGKLRVLHMTPPIVNNGVYRYIFNNWEYMDHEEFDFGFLMQAPNELKKTKEYKKYGFDIRKFSIPQRVNPERFRDEIYSILSDGYDVLHLHTSYWRGFMIEEIAMEIGVPRVIVHSHSSAIDQNDPVERSNQLEIHNNLKDRFSDKLATDFWACSNLAAQWLFGPQIPQEKIRILPNAINVENYMFDQSVRDRVRNKNGLCGKLVLGNIGRFEYQKNQSFLIDVFKRVRDSINNAFLVLIGEGLNEGELRKRICKYGLDDYVLFVGWQDNVNEWLQAFDVFCLPSLFEGFPISLVEAQTSGLKCIVSKNVTNEANLTGDICYECLDAEKWASKIGDWASGYDRSDSSDDVIEAGYDIRSAAKKLENYYKGDFS